MTLATRPVAPPRSRPPVWQLLTAPSGFGRPDREAVAAHGTRIRFADGSHALCATSGLWNVPLGYGNEVIAEAVARALREASYLTLFRFGHRYASQAADALLAAVGPGRFGQVLFSTSGGAANDAAMKLVRQHAVLRGEPHRRIVVGLTDSYHGLTYGAFALTGEDLWQEMYGVDRRAVRHVPPNADAALSSLLGELGDRVAAVVLEPVLGMGAKVLTDGYVETVLRLREQYGYLVVADEVTTGFGRTGRFLACEQWSTPPDLVILSKGLTNGTCGAAVIMIGDTVCDVFERADAPLVHAETQAGAPPSSAAIMATLAEMDRLGAVRRAARLSELLDRGIEALVASHPMIEYATGRGCFRALHLKAGSGGDAVVAAAVESIRRCGAIVHPGPGCIQLIPALVYDDGEAAELFDCVERGLDALAD